MMDDFVVRAIVEDWDVNEVKDHTLHDALIAHAIQLEADAEMRERDAQRFRKHAAVARAAASAAEDKAAELFES